MTGGDETKGWPMNSVVAVIVAAVLGAGLAVSVAIGVVSTQESTPAPVDQPLVTYGER